jgi:hypothetical protein
MNHDTNGFDHELKTPFILCISGGSQAGKTTLTREILERLNEIVNKCFNKIIFCYGEAQPKLFQELQKSVPSVEFHKGLPDSYENDTSNPILYIFDDLMSDVANSKQMVNLFCGTSHHQNISIIFLTQVFFYKNLNPLTRQLKYLVLMKNPRENSHIATIGRQMNAGKKNECLELAHADAMRKPFGYVFIDFSASQDDRFRIRSSIFPNDCIIYMK